jgi:ParB family transcriptional regulator, chromosome partitioning protein
MAKMKGLGRGLDALLGDQDTGVSASQGVTSLPLELLQPGKFQPRSHMDEEALTHLADSIREQGVMQPIIVRMIGHHQYEIIAGERRWRASKKAGLTEVPVIVRDIPDESALAMALIENIQREDLNPVEEAVGIERLINEFELTHEMAAKAVGRSRSAVTNLLRLLQLNPLVQQMLMQSKLDMGHARALLGLEGALQITAANEIVAKQLSVRSAEQLVKKLAEPVSTKPVHKAIDQDVRRLQDELSEHLGASVSIEGAKNGSGTLKIRYTNLDQLDSLIKKLR